MRGAALDLTCEGENALPYTRFDKRYKTALGRGPPLGQLLEGDIFEAGLPGDRAEDALAGT